jgi:hypothetical protein
MSQETLTEFEEVVPLIFKSLEHLIGLSRPIRWRNLKAKPFLISSATPAVGGVHLAPTILSTSPIGIIRSAKLLINSPIWESIRQ